MITRSTQIFQFSGALNIKFLDLDSFNICQLETIHTNKYVSITSMLWLILVLAPATLENIRQMNIKLMVAVPQQLSKNSIGVLLRTDFSRLRP